MTNSRKFTLQNGWIENEDHDVIAVIPENVSMADRKALEVSIEGLRLIQDFVTEINSKGVFKPRAHVKKFEQLLSRL